MSSTFDFLRQNVTLHMADGITPVTVLSSDIDFWFYYNCKTAILFGAQMGACLIMFVVTAILTRESKRRKPVFILNLLSLFLGFLRALLLALYSISPWTEFSRFFNSDFSTVPRSAYATSIAGAIIPLFMTITVNCSLVLQAHAVAQVMGRKFVYLISSLAFLVLLVAVGFRFAEAVTNSMAIISLGFYFGEAWVTMGALVTETISIWFFSIIFTGKLVWTIHTRKSLGFKQWSYIQILAAMGGCTMILPSIFAILEYITPDDFPEAGTLALTMVALLLPLSSLWASMATTEPESSFSISQLWASRSSLDSRNGSISCSGSGSGTRTKTDGSEGSSFVNSLDQVPRRNGSTAPMMPTTINSVIECSQVSNPQNQRDSTELDLEMMGVRVDRSYGFHTGKKMGGVGMT